MKHGHREKLSVSVDTEVYETVRRHAERMGLSRSRVIEEAVRVWERSRLAALAREGYEAMAGEDISDALAYLPALAELEP